MQWLKRVSHLNGLLNARVDVICEREDGRKSERLYRTSNCILSDIFVCHRRIVPRHTGILKPFSKHNILHAFKMGDPTLVCEKCQCKNISIFHGCMVWIEKSVTRVTDRHHEACRVMPTSDPE